MQKPPRKRQRRTPQISRLIDFTSSLLSDEIVLHVFSYLSANDLAQCAMVSTGWSRLANDELLWRPLFLDRFRHRSRLNSCNVHPWKTKYKISHNWRSGNCQIVHSERKQPMPPCQPCIQSIDSILCQSNSGSQIEIWSLKKNRILGYLQALSHQEVPVTCLKLIKTSQEDIYHLVAGYEHGGMAMWEIEIVKGGYNATEWVDYRPSARSADSVVSIAMAYPVVAICTAAMKISLFNVNQNTERKRLGLIYQLQSPVHWTPVELDLKLQKPSAGCIKDRWRLLVCFGMGIGTNAYSIGIQEIIVSLHTLISSRHCSALDQDTFFFTPNLTNTTQPPITAIAYDAPFLATAHANNTIRHYRVDITPDVFNLVFLQTLYGHTCMVTALTLDGPARRLVSADRTGLRIWDLACTKGVPMDRSGQLIKWHQGVDYLVRLDLEHDEDYPWQIDWLCSDATKIVALKRPLVPDAAMSLVVWSFGEN
ncbi:hypothetical protein J3Q64DRAFT_1737219 [Phycomyces blakesleeanus]|uniref:F-box domain-containing protein n=1 Tax=Phycomyces blakesleeanus TaxID=4837 RepID=A0ABR3B1E9_PHYBL